MKASICKTNGQYIVIVGEAKIYFCSEFSLANYLYDYGFYYVLMEKLNGSSLVDYFKTYNQMVLWR